MSPDGQRTLARPRPRTLAALAALALLAHGATCDNEDIFGPVIVDASADAPTGIALPYVGRLALDLAVHNRGDAPASLRLDVQSVTSGSESDTACARMDDAGIPVQAVRAVQGTERPETSETIPLLRQFRARYAIAVPASGPLRPVVRFRAPERRRYNFYFDADMTGSVLLDATGEIIQSPERPRVDACPRIVDTRTWRLAAGLHYLVLPVTASGTIGVVVEEECEDLRQVPRTCPGAVSPILVRQVDVPPGEVAALRLGDDELGIGDRITVALDCPYGTSCDARADLFPRIAPLDCRTNADCGAGGDCSVDGFCLSGGTCAVAPIPPSPFVPALFIAAALLARRRGAR